MANVQQWKWFDHFITDLGLGNLYLPFNVFIVCDKRNLQKYFYSSTLSMDATYALYSTELGWGIFATSSENRDGIFTDFTGSLVQIFRLSGLLNSYLDIHVSGRLAIPKVIYLLVRKIIKRSLLSKWSAKVIYLWEMHYKDFIYLYLLLQELGDHKLSNWTSL